MYRLKPGYLSLIMSIAAAERISKEEAAIKVIEDFKDEICTDTYDQKKFIEAYEHFDAEIELWRKRGESEELLQQRINPPKNKAAHALFLRFYRAAKADLKANGRISQKTFKLLGIKCLAMKRTREFEAFAFARACINTVLYENDPARFRKYKKELIDLIKGTQYDIPEIITDIKQIKVLKARPLWVYPPTIWEMSQFIATDLKAAETEKEKHIRGFEDFQRDNLQYIYTFKGTFATFRGLKGDKQPAYMLKFYAFLSTWFKSLGKGETSTKIDTIIQNFGSEIDTKYRLIKELMEIMVLGLKALYK